MAQTHRDVVGSDRVPLAGSVAVGRTNPRTVIEVSVKLRRKAALPGLSERPPAALSRDDLATSYGARPQDLEAVTRAFEAYALKVVAASSATRTLRLSGTVGQMESAFQVRLFDYRHSRGNYRGRRGRVQVPADVAGLVTGVFGLDNRRVVRRLRRPVHQSGPATSLSVPSGCYLPDQLASHYNFPPGDGTNQVLGLLEFGGGYFPEDLTAFCQLTGRAAPTVIPISVDGTATNSHDEVAGEVMLDVEIIAGFCPKATIVVYFAEWTEQGWISILDAVLRDRQNNPGVLSVSYGEAEDIDIWTAQAMTEINESLQEAALLGITVCVSSGDDGSSAAVTDGHVHANFPASSPYVLGIGGTTITDVRPNAADIVWKEGDGLRSNGGGSTGGGVSAIFPRPSWQAGTEISSPNPGALSGRILPDVAANADWTASPYLLVVDGQSMGNGGTSAASPLWASLIARINQGRPSGKRVGYLTPLLYRNQPGGVPSALGSIGCTDVTTGNNSTSPLGGYAASPGYDAASGWGTPNGVALASVIPP